MKGFTSYESTELAAVPGLNSDLVIGEFNKVCAYAQERSGVQFDLGRNQIVDEQQIDRDRRVYKLRLYFKDFAGGADHITLKVRVDVTEYDRISLPIQERQLIHQYSDTAQLSAVIRCVKLEELLADKLKCLLQRRYAYDLFDLVYAVFINNELDVDRSEIVRVFLKKSIFEPSPAAAKRLLLSLPLDLLKGFWGKVVCPAASRISFERAASLLTDGIEALFAPFGGERMVVAFYPAEYRNPILEAGASRKLMKLTYHGATRLIEPYSLAYKRRRDGIAQEYFYAWDRSGGLRSVPGIKAFMHSDIQALEVTDEVFEPRFEIELSKAGDHASTGYFTGGGWGRRATFSQRPSSSRPRVSASTARYVVQCSYCGKRFPRTTPSTRLNEHKDKYGNRCYGRIGFRVS